MGRLATALLLLSATSLGCSRGDGTEPTYEGCASDENWLTFDDYISTARVQTDAASSPKWLMPANGAMLSASAGVSFSWQLTPSNGGSANGNASCAQFTPTSLGGLRPLHMPPVSGTVYDLHFAAGDADPYRVMTTKQSVTLPATTWQSFAGKNVEVTLYAAQLLRNEVAQGPFRATPLSIVVMP